MPPPQADEAVGRFTGQRRPRWRSRKSRRGRSGTAPRVAEGGGGLAPGLPALEHAVRWALSPNLPVTGGAGEMPSPDEGSCASF